MPFEARRLDDALLVRLPFCGEWAGLADPSDQGTGTCDPFDVRVRMAMYRHLVERLNPHGAFGERDALSPFWGYAAQLSWQHRSGRLARHAGPPPTHAIDPASWWGACNHALSVIPYAAAMELGAVPALRFEPASGGASAAYRRALAAWRDAVRAMLAARPGDDLEPARFAIWRAHLESIETAVRLNRPACRAMSRTERRFARGWVRMVDLFGAAALRTDLERIAPWGGGSMPGRILRDDDAAGGFADLSRHERSTLRSVLALGDRPAWRWALETRAWRRMMRARTARDEAELILAGILGRGRRVWSARVRAIAYATLPVEVIELGRAIRSG